MAFPLLAALALSAGLSGAQGYMDYRNQKKASKKAGAASAQAALQQALGGNQLQGAKQQQEMNPFDKTNLDEMMQQQLFQRIFSDLGNVTGKGGVG